MVYHALNFTDQLTVLLYLLTLCLSAYMAVKFAYLYSLCTLAYSYGLAQQNFYTSIRIHNNYYD